MAVADSIDAMSSDRPYRKGMPDEKLDAILRDGAGKQWDPKIVEAAFHVRDELRRIGKDDRKPLELDVDDWQAEMAGSESSRLTSSACQCLARACVLCWPHGPRRIRPRRPAARSDGAGRTDRAGAD